MHPRIRRRRHLRSHRRDPPVAQHDRPAFQLLARFHHHPPANQGMHGSRLRAIPRRTDGLRRRSHRHPAPTRTQEHGPRKSEKARKVTHRGRLHRAAGQTQACRATGSARARPRSAASPVRPLAGPRRRSDRSFCPTGAVISMSSTSTRKSLLANDWNGPNQWF